MTVPPTLALEQACQRVWDVVVVGAGPAGSMAARELARRAVAVLLVDKASFPRWKVCGCCLNGRAFVALRAAGLEHLPRRLGAVSLTRFQVAAQGRTAQLSLPAGAALSREAFDTALVEQAIESGAHFLPRTPASLSTVSREVRAVRLHGRGDPVEVKARLVLAANGLGHSLSPRGEPKATRPDPGSRIGAGLLVLRAPEYYRPGTIYMACGRGGYVGLVRLEDGRLDVGAALDPGFLKRCGGPGMSAATVLREAGLPAVAGLKTGAWRGTPLLTRPAGQPADHRLFILGDAAGYVEPCTGEGISWALTAAAAVVPVALRALHSWEPGLADDWRQVYQRTVWRRQFLCRALAAVLRRPILTRALIALLARAPGLAGPFIRQLNDPSLRFTGQGS